MAITNEYRVTDDDGHLDPVSVVPGEDDGEPVVILTSAGSEITVSRAMARQVIEAMENVLKDFSR